MDALNWAVKQVFSFIWTTLSGNMLKESVPAWQKDTKQQFELNILPVGSYHITTSNIFGTDIKGNHCHMTINVLVYLFRYIFEIIYL